MGWTTFKVTKALEDGEFEIEMPYSAPANIVQEADEILHGDTMGKIQGDKINASIRTGNIEKASHHIVKKLFEMKSIPRNTEMELNDLDGKSLNRLKQHYLEVDVLAKNSSQSDGEQK